MSYESERVGIDSVGQYLSEIGMVPLLTADEERELAQAVERGNAAREKQEREGYEQLSPGIKRAIRRDVRDGDEAKDRFIRANLRLVVSVARRYPVPPGMELLDLIQEGNLGLEHAVDKFDWRKGFKFSTYATFWIRQAIGRGMDQKATLVRLPGAQGASLRAALRQQSSGDEDGAELDAEHERMHRLTTPTSLNQRVGEEGDSELIELIEDETVESPLDTIIADEETAAVYGMVHTLSARAQLALDLRYGLSDGFQRSYKEVGMMLGVTAEAARRLVKNSEKYLREEFGEERSA